MGDASGPHAVTESSADLVTAARDGDRRAAAELMAAHLPMLYRIVGRALDGHADVDDVVQETVLRAHRELPALRTPESFRSWLIAIAMRQISSRLRVWQQERDRSRPLDDATQIPDPDADFADVTLLRIGLSGQRRQVTRAAAWLDPGDQELAALWWQELTGGRTRAEVAAALGVGAAHTRVRIQRMRHQLELSRHLVAALEAEPPCPELEALTAGWNGAPSPRWRKRFARHLRGCGRCGPVRSRLVPLERLLFSGALIPLPAAVGDALSADPLSPLSNGGAGWAKLAAVVVTGAAVGGTVLVTLPEVPPGAFSAAPTATASYHSAATNPTNQATGSAAAVPATAGDRVVIRPANSPDTVVDLDGDELVLTTGTAGAALTMTPGLAGQQCVSLRYPDGRYVRHASFRLVLSEPEDSRLFREDATFCPQSGAGTIRFTSFNYTDRFVRVQNGRLLLEPGEPGAAYVQSSTFVLTSA